MIDRQIKFDNDSNILRVKIRKADTGQGLTGLAYNTSGLIISTICDNEASATTYTSAATHIETISTLGTYAAPSASCCRFKEVDSTNHPGTYEIQLADARFAVASSRVLRVSILGATNLLERELVIELVGYDPVDGVRAGLTALPNAAAEASGGLYTRGTGAGQIAQDANGNVRVNLDTIKTQSVTCAAGVTVLASVGTAATSTAQTGDSYNIVKSGGTGDAAAIKAKTDNLPASPASTTNITAASGVTLAPTTGLGNQTANITGNLSGSVGSVTGAVGSVTGNVGGNVAGSVASVTGAVGSVTGAVGSVTGAVGSVTGAVGSVTAGVTLTAAYDAAKTATTAAGVWAYVVEGSTTALQAMRGLIATAFGKTSGGGTATFTIRDTADSKDRVVATVDADGNRTPTSVDLT